MSYIERLNKKDIIEFLKTTNYQLDESLYDNQGEKIPPYEKKVSKNSSHIFLRCKKVAVSTLNSKLSTSFSISDNSYFKIQNNAVLYLDDFQIRALLISDKEISELQKKYAKFMYKKFGETFRKEYNFYIKKLIKNEYQLNK